MHRFFSVKLSKILLIGTLLGVNAYVAAEQSEPAIKPSAAKLALQSTLVQLKSYQAAFSQKVVDIENTVLQEAHGTISLLQPNKLYWELLPPNDNILLADGQTLWNIDSFMEQVVAYNQTSAIENNPLILLTDPHSDKWLEFTVTRKNNDYTIKPIAQTGNVETLRLRFDSNNQLIQLETTDAKASEYIIVF
ncbi:outer membrane lipoprotein chaperone LolA [Paraglaciecola aquimarina]|uniref:Outer-membrane lipoprotein carrier protein n=1 Tax=Paraglaciecola aquimarina TaxID=1235557 RepID=A0ABU3SYB1_9ALTE|nr:outer membrane lipoprotein chaperone LolA [Paraglaciecola aquimarina]MDU0354981.1 outer membrane lipoprotein chaperone LolA [Paraglaciecola aquimarina]